MIRFTHDKWWVLEEESRLLALNARGLSARQLVAHFPRRTEKAIKKRLNERGRKSNPGDARKCTHPITDSEVERATSMLDDGFSMETVARRLNRSPRGLMDRLVAVGMYARAARGVPANVLAERDAVQAREPRDLTAAFCGDPLPGRSALDRMRGAS